MKDCLIINVNEKEDRYIIEFESSNIKVEPLKNSDITK